MRSPIIKRIPEQDYIIKTQDISDVVGLHYKTVCRMAARGDFPAPVELSTRQKGWFASDVYRWLESRQVG